jgi:hypothetical protein
MRRDRDRDRQGMRSSQGRDTHSLIYFNSSAVSAGERILIARPFTSEYGNDLL